MKKDSITYITCRKCLVETDVKTSFFYHPLKLEDIADTGAINFPSIVCKRCKQILDIKE